MKLVIQRVSRAEVIVEQKCVGSSGHGFLVLAGIEQGDTPEIVDKLARKTAQLRIFPDQKGRTNLSLVDVSGSILVVSQFTLCADMKRGNRPSFIPAAAPELAVLLINEYVSRLKAHGVKRVETGEFGAHMLVNLTNDGPFTIILQS